MQPLSEMTSFIALDSLWLESEYFPMFEDHDTLLTALPQALKELRLSGVGHHAAALRRLHASMTAGRFSRLKYMAIDDQGYESGSKAERGLDSSLCMLRAVGVNVSVLPIPASLDNGPDSP